MADYISREAFLAAKRKQYCENCDRRKGMKNGKIKMLYAIGDAPCRSCRIGDMLDEVEDYPAADVRPVVLCRDCKHFNPYPGDCTDGCIEGVCKRHNSIGVLVMDDDFCSDAERI